MSLFLLMKDFKYYKNNQPFEYKENKILYMTFIINSFYSFLVAEKNEQIIILTKYLYIINYFNTLIISLKNDLKKSLNNNNEFFIKIRFLFLLFESKSTKYRILSNDFQNHIIDKNNAFTIEKAKKFKIDREALDNIDKRNHNKYIISDEYLEIKIDEYSVKYKYNEYSNDLSYKLICTDDLLSPLWTYNSLNHFQNINFLEEKDIKYLKNVLMIILKSIFWKELEDKYINKELYEGYLFDNDNKISEFIDNIIFVPFYSKNLGVSSFTFSDDLKIFISGYPHFNNIYFENYKLNKILHMSLLIITLIHECIQYSKEKIIFFNFLVNFKRNVYTRKKRRRWVYLWKFSFWME